MNSIPNNDVDRLGVVFDDDSLVSDAGLLIAGDVDVPVGVGTAFGRDRAAG